MSALVIVMLSVTYGIFVALTACRVGTLLAYYWMGCHNRSWAGYGGKHQLRSPSTEEWCGGIATGLVAGIAWPLVSVAWLARGVLFKPPASVVEQRQKERIAELEAELGLAEKEVA